jgi:hypothetical protein
MQILIMETAAPAPRAEAYGWSCDDLSEPEGSIPRYVRPGSPLDAIAHDWKILAPPKKLPDGGWEWWFTRGHE